MSIRYFSACAALAAVLLSARAAEPDGPIQSLPYRPSLDPASLDTSVDACADLYRYSCGGWKKNNPIPEDQSTWSVYHKLADDNQHFLWGILEDAAKSSATRSAEAQKIGDYFTACMDVDAVEKADSAPLAADLARLDAISDKHALAEWVGNLHARTDVSGIFFAVAVEQDARDATKVIAGIHAGGIGLPDRDYYVKDDPHSREARERYVAHIAKMFELLGADGGGAQADASVVMRIETALAKATLTRVEQRDPYKVYHRQSVTELKRLAPDFDWQAYFSAVGMQPDPWLNVAQPEFIKEFDAQLAHGSLPDLKTYLRWTLVDAVAGYLSRKFADEEFAFYGAYLRGVPVDEPRWKKCVNWIDRDLSEALGKVFVARAFPPEMKAKALLMTEQIEAAMKTRIEQLDWMQPSTKRAAIEKLAKVRNKIGYPDVWRDYSQLLIARDDFFGDVRRSLAFEAHRQAAKIGQPVDRGEWQMSAPTVNAYYDPPLNDVNFPAGVLLPPLYDAKIDDAPNYGDTGGTIGHELTHGFDDEGRLYDGDGNLREWWTRRDAAAFDSRANCIRNQYSQYVIFDDVKINGPLTSGEDIADLGGELLAWMAWRDETSGQKLAPIDGLTPEQRFFVGFAQWACSNERPQAMRLRAVVDPHSPPRARINEVVTNMPEFAQAFHCKPGQALYKAPEKMCKIW